MFMQDRPSNCSAASLLSHYRIYQWYMQLIRQEVEMAGLFSKHLEYCTGPSVSTKMRSLSVFFKSTFLSSEYTSGGPYDTYSPLSIDFANCFLLPANQCNSALLILYDGSISKMASSILLE